MGDVVPVAMLPFWPPTTVMLLQRPGSLEICVPETVKYWPQPSTDVLFHCSW